LQLFPAGQFPQLPPQPSDPQALPAQLGVQEVQDSPLAAQACPAGQVPQVPPQPSGPHFLFTQLGVQAHRPSNSHVPPLGQVPHVPPQPSGPHCLPVQEEAQLAHCWLELQL
jgi:hypothetical protein